MLQPRNNGGKSKASAITRSRNSCHARRRSLSVPAEAQHLGLVLHRKYRDTTCSLDLVLPPVDQALVLRRIQVLQPERVLHHEFEARRAA